MCLILFAWKVHKEFPLILAANRDEFYNRPTKRVHWWEGDKEILAGKDLKAGGSWMGMDRNGRFAAVTNYREFPITKSYESSRGDLVTNFVKNEYSNQEYLKILENTGQNYDGFNLIFGDRNELYYFGNKSASNGKIEPGIHGLSNHLLNTPWPKVEKGKKRIEELVNEGQLDEQQLFRMLNNHDYAEDKNLPDTGIGFEMEKKLSSMFISMDGYGTRSSTVLKIDKEGLVNYTERTTDSNDIHHYEFQV